MTPEVAQNALKFLNRVDLKGSEAHAMFQCLAELNAEASKQPPPIDPPDGTGKDSSEDTDGNDDTTG